MNRTEQLLGILLGEIYHLKSKVDPDAEDVPPSVVFALRNNVEGALDQLLERRPFRSKAKIEAMDVVLYEYHKGDSSLSGYYEIEHRLESAGITRGDAAVILEYFVADSRYGQLVAMMDSNNSPIQIRSTAEALVKKYGIKPRNR